MPEGERSQGPEFVTSEEFARLCRTTVRTVDGWVYKRVAPPHFRIGKRRLWRRQDVLRWIEEHVVDVAKEPRQAG
jgi:predicted DNA-binding transcriptional regulator AlpA